MQLTREAERTCCQKVRDENDTELYPVRAGAEFGLVEVFSVLLLGCGLALNVASGSGGPGPTEIQTGAGSRCIAGAPPGVPIQIQAAPTGIGVWEQTLFTPILLTSSLERPSTPRIPSFGRLEKRDQVNRFC